MSAVLYAMLLCLAGSLPSLLHSWRDRRLAGWFTFGITGAAGVLTLWASVWTILHGPSEPSVFPQIEIWGSVLRFSLDGLGSVFLGLISLIAPLAALYSISHMDHYAEYNVGRYYPWFLLFILGMYGIVTVTDTMVFFFVFWQIMTIPSFILIRFEYKKAENIRAANKYLVIMEIACLLVMAGSAVLVYTGTVPQHIAGLPRFDFDTLRERITSAGAHPHALFPALALMFAGFGIKAGIWPFGLAWLPDAHPAAPSPVSALLSGVMIKTGVYGLMRTFFWLVPNASVSGFSPAFWGAVLAAFGTITLAVGTFQALKQEQTKRLLAFHSIGQIGYIILGLGACLILLPQGPAGANLAVLALIGALFHTLNHGLFKSLLFFNAGSILSASGTQDLNKLGGLVRYMPVTAVTCLVASFSIAGVPLFNGFASKWSIYVPTILGGKAAPFLPLCGLFGILTSALTLASFMKFFGVSFLTRASSTVSGAAKAGHRLEADLFMQLPQVILAASCLLLGLFPAAAYGTFGSALASGPQGISRLFPPVQVGPGGFLSGIAPVPGSAFYIPLLVAGILILLLLFAAFFARLGQAERRKADIWLCGYDREADIHRYGAHNLYGEVKRLFSMRPHSTRRGGS
jgi:formate hydrogenlyase subunit 3/multisubunit Na+/H+ antiporter MnhD subunit